MPPGTGAAPQASPGAAGANSAAQGRASNGRPLFASHSAALRNDIGPTSPETPPDAVSAQKTEDLLQMAKDATPSDVKTPDLFDPQRGTNIVFVLDRSSNMRPDDKSKAARRALVKALESLDTNKTFYVIFFPYKEMPGPGPIRATPENTHVVADWIDSVLVADHADPAKALARGLGFSPDTVWLLSGGQLSPEAARAIRQANEVPRAQINTVAFYSRDGESVLRQIADENRGTYQFVPEPDKSPGP